MLDTFRSKREVAPNFMTEEEKQNLIEFMRIESCGARLCEKCGKCKICNYKCEINELKDIK